MLTVIVYQISSNKTRSKLRKLLLDFGYAVQNGVFEFRLTKEQRARLTKDVKQFEDKLVTGDSIRLYNICGNCINKALIIGSNPITTDPLFYIV